MRMFRWGNWDPFRDLEREVDRLLASVNFSVASGRYRRQFPAINVCESETELTLLAELPGARVEDLEISVANGVLTIQGTRNGPEGIPEERFRRQERDRGPFRREISLPERIIEDGMTAEFLHGVLRVRLPKAPAAAARHIPIQNSETSVPQVLKRETP